MLVNTRLLCHKSVNHLYVCFVLQLLKLLRRDVIPRRYMRVRILTQLYHRGHKVEMHSVYKCFETEEEGRMTYSQLLFSVRAVRTL